MIYREQHKTNFLVMSKIPVDDKRSTYKAKGILNYLLSKPDDWELNIVDIANHTPEGITAIKSGIKELISLGYIKTYRVRDEKKHLKPTIYDIYEKPFNINEKIEHNQPFTDENLEHNQPFTDENLEHNQPFTDENLELGNLEQGNLEQGNLDLGNLEQGNLIYNNNKYTKNDITKNERKIRKTSAPLKGARQPPNSSENRIEYLLAELLWYFIKNRGKLQKTPDLEEWTKHIRLMITKDHISPADIEKVIVWCQQDNFWQDNIRSTGKLRKQFNILSSAMYQKDINPKLVQKVIEAYNTNFLGTTQHSRINTSESIKLSGAACKIVRFSRQSGLSYDEVLASLIRCLSSLHTERGDMVFPGHLCSDHTWNILMPQYLKGTFNPKNL